ncbi:uncharacterized protein B0H18DRAFT_1103306 [Fomitopsis serialis]|uniref:uncharacterized protein n=1 Tax=Fomitopsis serialis TaxID=139415 RepID=UPI00200782A4|nr:uncharacterized protein B0H18DRAFT_1103306 [Neoantrodia serialis]KAH9929676.1 hypothetical protein B0H18DRAFT_1103306 [Neoantrodia serialis]
MRDRIILLMVLLVGSMNGTAVDTCPLARSPVVALPEDHLLGAAPDDPRCYKNAGGKYARCSVVAKAEPYVDKTLTLKRGDNSVNSCRKFSKQRLNYYRCRLDSIAVTDTGDRTYKILWRDSNLLLNGAEAGSAIN